MNTTASAKVLLDSINEQGDRLTTMEVVMWRAVLAEFNTHRVFSRNSASSRAIPVEKQLNKVNSHPAWPVLWAAEQPGMQGGEELTGNDLFDAQGLFAKVHRLTVQEVNDYLNRHPEKDRRLHKSLVNRLLEPFMWHTVIVSSTEWQNFFNQRCTRYSPLAQPEMRAAADAMLEAYENSTPLLKGGNQWHTPLIQIDDEPLHFPVRQKVSAARCARVSYLTHDGTRDITKDIELFTKLVSAKPMHSSPLEHVAVPCIGSSGGNFKGWKQLRYLVENGQFV